MSYRSSDAYSRRPLEDDRRPTDSHDRRREPFPRRSSDFSKEDRYNSPKDRRHSSDLSRDPLPPKRTKSDSAVPSSVHEQGSKAASASRSLLESASRDSSISREKILALWKTHDKALIEVARLRSERDPLDKVLRARQADYEKSMVKHGDFPSVAELQNMHRRKYGEQVRALDGRIQQALDEAEKTAEAFASAIFDLSWAQNGQHGNRPAAAPEFPKERETLKNQQNEINELKMQLRQLQAERSKEQEELKGEMARRLREEMEKMRNEFKMEMKAREQSNQTIQAQLSKQDREIKTIVEQQVSGQNNSTGNISTSEVSTLIQQGSSGLRSDLVDLTRRVDEITARLAQNGQDTASLCASIAIQVQRLDDQTEKLQCIRKIVENIDLETLDTLADVSLHDFPTWRIKMMTVDNLKSNLENLNGHEFPRLRKDVEGLRLSVDDLKAKNNSLSDMVQDFSNRVVTTVGGLVNNLEQNTRNHEARISQLEGASTDGGRPSTTEMDSANSANPADAVNLQVNAIRTDFDSTKAAVAELSQQVNQISQTMEANSKDFNEQLGTLSHLVSVLNMRWNNLSTKSLAEHIIAQLELIYPNAREIVADIARLKALVERLNGWIKTLEEQVQSFKGKVNGNEDTAETPLPALQEHLELVPDFRSNGVSHKRRRPDSSPNGAAQTIVARTD